MVLDMAKALGAPVVKLKNERNLREWKESLDTVFMIYGLKGFLTGTTKAPGDDATEEQAEDYIMKKAVALGIIRISVSDVRDIIISFGLKEDNEDLKYLYDTVTKAIGSLTTQSM